MKHPVSRRRARRAGGVAAMCLALAAAPPALAGPWATGRGRTYLKLGYARLSSTELANPDGSHVRIPRLLKQELQTYLALGLSDNWTFVGSAPLVRSSDLRDFRRESGVGDVQLALQRQLGRTGVSSFAVRGTLQLPTGDETRAEGLLPTGSGVWEGELRLGAGRSLAGGRGYAFVEAGHLWREGLRDAAVYDAQLGWHLGPRFTLAANLRGVETYDKSPREVALGSFVGVGDRVTYTALGATLLVKLGGGLGAQLDATDTLRERNLAVGPQFSVGLSLAR